ncbi:YbfB/YjiJ family MFS transporter [Thiopseudomonas alkaliphila]|uniref:YbfB/YjiJ family MFS transporter n=1 Tax=Thiopseudomonas alkaliphila TaxID=1697053 RepID=UPI00069DAF5C|nr:YbfB/YjiJ family MFS transporter [Thiopseudomonas alkaliphila]AKX51232.1 transporter [Thiopseudomonas alkaliphila]AKX57588.1 transporter [Thiopseudomonas alkaliphila]
MFSAKLTLGRTLLAGALLLLVVHTLGRFIYTPMLPRLVDDGLLTLQQGATIATWNYVGYLLGALIAMRWYSLDKIKLFLPWAVGFSVLSTFAQTQAETVGWLTLLRLINGITNGIVFVQVPSLILEWLNSRGKAALSGLVYLGVGAGLIISSLAVSLPAPWLQGAERWWPAALLALPMAVWGWRQLSLIEVQEIPVASAPKNKQGKVVLFDRASIPLFLSYAGAGLGYILPMTFLPMLARLLLEQNHLLIDGSWLLVALSTLPAAWLWNRLGGSLGDGPALRLNYAVQLLGVLAVILLPGPAGIVLCALLVGNTFLGTVLLTQRLARSLHPHQGPKLSAALVALYGFTQLTGPWLTRLWLDAGGTLQSAFWFGAAALAWGLLWSLLVPRPCT